MRIYFCLLALVLVSDPFIVEAAEPGEPQRPQVALVLSGGGARGLAHVGVLQILEEMKVPVDCVVGTSMGALVGGSYAAGVQPAKMRRILAETDIGLLFDDLPPRSLIPQRIKRDDYRPYFDFTLGYNDGQVQLPVGASAGYKFELFLKKLIGPGASVAGIDFDLLPTRYRAIATDLETGEMRVFQRGDLPKVMRASMSLPAVVAPTEIDGSLYVDGGLVHNLPVDIGRQLCGDIVIAVNLGTPLVKRQHLRSVVDVASQSVHLMMEQNVKRSLGELTGDDILIEPELDGFSASDFDAKAQIIEKGVAAARAKQPALSRLSLDAQAYDRWLAERKRRELPALEIARVRVDAGKGFDPRAVERDLTVKPGKDFNAEDLDRDVSRIYGRADFAYLGYSVIPEEEGATLTLDAAAKPWGPGYLRFGLGALSDFSGPTQLNLAASYRRTWANSLGAEWRIDAQIGYDSFLGAEFIQPLQIRDGAFFAPYAEVQRKFVQFYQQELRLGQYQINTETAGLDAGLSNGLGELRLGPYVAHVRAKPDFGFITSLAPEEDFSVAGIRLSGVADHLDRPRFARSGWSAAANVRTESQDNGGQSQHTRAVLALRGVTSFDKNTFSALLEIGETPEGKLAIYDGFKLGGPLRLSGLYLDQLTGTRYNLGTLTYYRKYASLPQQLGRGLYLGMSAEAGRMNDTLMKNPWSWIYSGSVFWAADTILGAVVLSYGYSSLDQSTAYLMIGPRF